MNIAQISRLTGRGAGLVTDMIESVPLLGGLQFQAEASSHLIATGREAKSGSGARNEGDTALRTAVKPDVTPRNLALLTREVSIDNLRIQDVQAGRQTPEGLRNFYDAQLRVEGIGLAEEFIDDVFAGTDANDGNGKYRGLGLREFVKDANAAGQTARFGFSQADLAAMNSQLGLKIDTEDNQRAFMEHLEKVLGEVPGANLIIVNTNLGARLSTIAKRLGAAGESVDTFGRRVETVNGIPIYRVSVTALPQTESDGVNNDNCSMFVARAAEQTGLAVTTNSGILFQDFEETSQLPSGVARLEVFWNLAPQSRKCVRRISRIRL